jgi:hypothetical protein
VACCSEFCISGATGQARRAFALDDISGSLALVFEIAQGFVIAAKEVNVGSQEEAVAGRALKLNHAPHGFPDCLEAVNKAPLLRFVRHV